MSTRKTLNIVNYFGQPIDVAVTGENFNCCDSPRPGQAVGHIANNGAKGFTYLRTDGHGCNGRQGQFQLSFESDYDLNMEFDGDGNLEISTAPTNFGAYLNADKDGNFTLAVGQHPHN